MTSYKTEIIRELTAEILAAGFRVFIAQSGGYGFFTDAAGSRVVSFGVDLGSIKFSGNYKTDNPRQAGTGWVMGAGSDYQALFNSSAPYWAVGPSRVKLTTLTEYLATYQRSSNFGEVAQ